MPLTYSHQGEAMPAGYPFLVDYNGDMHIFKPDTTRLSAVPLNRKYPIREYAHHTARKMEGGRFEASNTAEFSTPVHVHTIRNASGRTHDIALPDTLGPYRYWRYIQNAEPDSHCNIAELAFLDSEGKELTGTIIGTDAVAESNPTATRDKAFDHNPLTYFDALPPEGGWVGMDFGRPIAINRIRFTPRGDGNNIEPGDTYEMFYCSSNGWKSLGSQTADDITLTYGNVPANALLLLVDLTKGREHRIFTFENGRQKFH